MPQALDFLFFGVDNFRDQLLDTLVYNTLRQHLQLEKFADESDQTEALTLGLVICFRRCPFYTPATLKTVLASSYQPLVEQHATCDRLTLRVFHRLVLNGGGDAFRHLTTQSSIHLAESLVAPGSCHPGRFPTDIQSILMGDSPTTRVPCPYVLGATFKLEISPPHGSPFVIEMKVVHVYSPFTMSSAMKVTFTPPPGSMLPGEAVLKLYDRRFADDLREEYMIDPPTYEGEARYAEYLRSGNIAQTVDEVYALLDEVPEEDPDPLELVEHLAAVLIKPFFENEKTTYGVLSSLQGKYIPTFYGTTRFLDASSPEFDMVVPGILIEFIPGTNLSRINPTSIDLDSVCSTAVDIVNTYSDFSVLNRDVRLENFIVKPSGSEIVMIDFGQCRLRREDEDDQTWKRAKWSVDEEGCVGCVAQNKFGWNYVRSMRFAVLADE